MVRLILHCYYNVRFLQSTAVKLLGNVHFKEHRKENAKTSNEIEVHVDLYQIFKRNSIVNNHCIHLKIFNVTFIRKNTNKTQFKFRVLKTSSIHHRKAYKN